MTHHTPTPTPLDALDRYTRGFTNAQPYLVQEIQVRTDEPHITARTYIVTDAQNAIEDILEERTRTLRRNIPTLTDITHATTPLYDIVHGRALMVQAEIW